MPGRKPRRDKTKPSLRSYTAQGPVTVQVKGVRPANVQTEQVNGQGPKNPESTSVTPPVKPPLIKSYSQVEEPGFYEVQRVETLTSNSSTGPGGNEVWVRFALIAYGGTEPIKKFSCPLQNFRTQGKKQVVFSQFQANLSSSKRPGQRPCVEIVDISKEKPSAV